MTTIGGGLERAQVTEESATNNKLAQCSELLSSLIDHLHDGLWVADLNGNQLAVNPALCRMTGYSARELMTASMPFPFWPADDADKIKEICERIREGDLEPTEMALIHKSGERFPVLLRPSLLRDASGAVVAIFATIMDITQQKRIALALQDSERRWRSIVENPFDFVVIVDRNLKYQFINHMAPGLRREDLIDKLTPYDFAAPQFHDEMRRAFETAFNTGQPSSFEIYSPQVDGWFTTIVGPIKSGGEVTALSLLTRNTTDAKHAEQAKRRSERRLALAIDGSNDGLFDWSLVHGTLFYSSRTYELLGFAPGDPELSTTADGLDERLHPDDHAQVTAALRVAIKNGTAFNEEYRLRTRDGQYRWFHGRGRTFIEDDHDARFLGFLTDITQRRELAHELQQAQRLETIGTLAGGIAHDFNNLLTPILGGIELAQLAVGVGHPAQVELREAANAALRAKSLTQQVLTFARHGEFRREPVALAEVAREALLFCAASLPANIELHSYFQCDCPAVLGDRTQLQQILSNLIDNARQEMQLSGGRLMLRVESVDGAPLDAHHTAHHAADSEPAIGSGPHVRIVVADTGRGMTEAVRRRVFEPFFTTKAAGQGTGLGLSVVHGIVKRHRGSMRVQSTPGQGTTFEVYLPATSARPEETVRSAPNLTLGPTGKRVLCVDDEPSVLGTLKRALHVAGYLVSGASDADEALRLLRTSNPAFDLVITDYRMPGMSGLELARRARALQSQLPIILITGHAEGLPQQDDAANVNAIMGKPFLLNDLLASVQECLGAVIETQGKTPPRQLDRRLDS